MIYRDTYGRFAKKEDTPLQFVAHPSLVPAVPPVISHSTDGVARSVMGVIFKASPNSMPEEVRQRWRLEDRV